MLIWFRIHFLQPLHHGACLYTSSVKSKLTGQDNDLDFSRLIPAMTSSEDFDTALDSHLNPGSPAGGGPWTLEGMRRVLRYDAEDPRRQCQGLASWLA